MLFFHEKKLIKKNIKLREDSFVFVYATDIPDVLTRPH